MAEKTDRICIIGGGPAGISTAMYLQKKGYENYVIFERLNKIGGKCYSPRIDVNGEARTYETGLKRDGSISLSCLHTRSVRPNRAP